MHMAACLSQISFLFYFVSNTTDCTYSYFRKLDYRLYKNITLNFPSSPIIPSSSASLSNTIIYTILPLQLHHVIPTPASLKPQNKASISLLVLEPLTFPKRNARISCIRRHVLGESKSRGLRGRGLAWGPMTSYAGRAGFCVFPSPIFSLYFVGVIINIMMIIVMIMNNNNENHG